jgi:hypothetical protein
VERSRVERYCSFVGENKLEKHGLKTGQRETGCKKEGGEKEGWDDIG